MIISTNEILIVMGLMFVGLLSAVGVIIYIIKKN
jgi:hypothetical protein